MRKICTLLLTAIVMSIAVTQAGPQAIVVGNGNRTINIIDIESKEVLWQHSISFEDRKCNSVTLLKDGKHIAFSTLSSAQVVSIESNEVVWEYRPEGGNSVAEVHSVVSLGKEGFAVFVAMETILVMEVSADFEVKKRVQFTNFKGSGDPHGMFRLVSMSKDGNYLFRWSLDGMIYRVNRIGDIIDKYNPDYSAFAITELKGGNILFGTGDGSKVVEYNHKTERVVHEISSFSKGGERAWIQCVGQCDKIGKDRYIVTNWVGHQKRALHMVNKTDFIPILMIVDGTGEILWHYTLEDAKESLNLTLGATGIYYSKKAIIK